jgi:hypothetical protein
LSISCFQCVSIVLASFARCRMPMAPATPSPAVRNEGSGDGIANKIIVIDDFEIATGHVSPYERWTIAHGASSKSATSADMNANSPREPSSNAPNIQSVANKGEREERMQPEEPAELRESSRKPGL